jgi:NAD(P)-dependent dehydrogenase (short-subunit alcohol dehydrogenase family)
MSRLTGALDGHAVVVTGAGRGLGRAYAVAAAAEGAAVVVNDVDADAARETAELAAASGARVEVVAGSVAEWRGAERVVRHCVEAFGAIDGLVNNAGVLRATGPAWEAGEDALREIVEVNVLGAMFCGVHALRSMVPRGRGSIVNVISGAALGLEELAAYGATKGAVLSMTYGWAVDAGSTGVRVNALSPLARTPMGDVWAAGGQDGNLPPEAIAPAVVYLLADRAAAVHGQVLRFDGRTLALLTPPRLAAASGERTNWTVDDIAAAVSGELGAAMAPAGLAAGLPPELLTRPE